MTQPSTTIPAGLDWHVPRQPPASALRAFWRAAFGRPAGRPDPADRFGQALQACADGRWQPAYDQLAALADEGHAEAMRLALQMTRHGQRLFGLRCNLLPQRRARWAALAWSAGRTAG